MKRMLLVGSMLAIAFAFVALFAPTVGAAPKPPVCCSSQFDCFERLPGQNVVCAFSTNCQGMDQCYTY